MYHLPRFAPVPGNKKRYLLFARHCICKLCIKPAICNNFYRHLSRYILFSSKGFCHFFFPEALWFKAVCYGTNDSFYQGICYFILALMNTAVNNCYTGCGISWRHRCVAITSSVVFHGSNGLHNKQFFYQSTGL